MNPSHTLQSRFLALLPRIESYARFHFRGVRCANRKADRIAEVIALAWKWFLRLEERGKDVTEFLTVFVNLAVRSVRSGRRLAGMLRVKDVLSSRAQYRQGFAVMSLPNYSTQQGNSFDDALRDNTHSEPGDAAAFRIDFPRWLATLNPRDRRLAHDLMLGEKARVAARKVGVSAARVSQLRQELCDNWKHFHGETVCTDVPSKLKESRRPNPGLRSFQGSTSL